MKFSCDRSTLNEAVATVQKAVSTRSNVPVLEGILLDAAGGVLHLSGNDLDLAIESEISAIVEEPGSIVINARFFGDIIRKMADETLYLQADEECNIQIKCGNAEFTLTGIPAHEFPEIAAVNQTRQFTIPDEVLKNMIKQTLFAVGTDENKVILTGSLFEIQNGVLSVVSVDGFRLALRREAVESEDMSFVVPAKALNEVLKILKEDEAQTTIGIAENKVQFDIGSYRVVSRLLEGEFLDYQQILPKQSKLNVLAETRPIAETIERAALMIENESTKYPVKLTIKTDLVNVSCVSKMGKMFDSVPVVTEGDDLEIGFNYRYLLDALKVCDCEKVKMELNTPLSPCIIRPETGDSFLYLVLPVRMKS